MTTPTRILVRAPLVPAEGLIFFYGHAHRLIAALFDIVGIADHATVALRKN